MTTEEAIKIIEIAKAEVEWDYPLDYQIAFDMAIDDMKKQIQKEPNRLDINHITAHHCPSCGSWITRYIKISNDFHSINQPMNFCYNCGQTIDWSET